MKTAEEALQEHRELRRELHRSKLELKKAIWRDATNIGDIEFDPVFHEFTLVHRFTTYKFEMYANCLVIGDRRTHYIVPIKEKRKALKFGKKLFKRIYGVKLNVKACNYWQDIEEAETGVAQPALHEEVSFF